MRRLSTERLTLRPPTVADAPLILGLLNEPGYLANIGDRGVRTLADAAAYLTTAPIFAVSAEGLGYAVVERTADAEPLGIAGLVKRETLDDPDLGYAIVSHHAGQGYATEAASAVLAYARDELKLATVLAVTTTANMASRRVLEQIGFQLQPDGSDAATCLYAA